MRKIDETRKRASDIVGQRRRNMEMQRQKLERQQNQMAEVASKTQMHMYMKEENAKAVSQNKKMAFMKTKQEAIDTK